jgi:hypothetical protein
MFQIDNATAAATKPASTPPGNAGYFTDGNPATNQAATIVPAEWLNSIMLELLNVLTAAGVTPDKAQFNQLATAIGNNVKASAPVIGAVRSLAINVAAGATNAAVRADEIIVGTALGGRKYVLANVNATLNLAITGAGGMDTGTATANGFLGIYAIYNPATSTSAVLGTMEAAARLPSVYGGTLPSGYTASALLTVVPISATAGQFADFVVNDRTVRVQNTSIMSGSFTATTPTYAANTVTAVPYTARRLYPRTSMTPGAVGTATIQYASTASGVGGGPTRAPQSGTSTFTPEPVEMVTPRTIYAAMYNGTAGSTAYSIGNSQYDI